MNTTRRRQREVAAREQLILDAAANLLGETGHQGFSMDRVAEAVEYSKGTIYQHFACKEELLAGLCVRGMRTLLELFERAAAEPGTPRERMLAMGYAYDLFVRLHPVEFANMQALKSASVREKTSAESRCTMQDLEAQIMRAVSDLVREAVARGELSLPPGLGCEALVFGLWSLQYGAMSLRTSGIPFDELGVADPALALQSFVAATLDGLGWQPTSARHDYAPVYERLRDEVFAAELARLQDVSCARQGGTVS